MRAIVAPLNTGPSVADLDAFAQLPDDVRALVVRVYGGEPDALEDDPAPSARARIERMIDDLKDALEDAAAAIRRAEDEADDLAHELDLG